MTRRIFTPALLIAWLITSAISYAQPATQPNNEPTTQRGRGRGRGGQPLGNYKLSQIPMRDICILADPATKTYYLVGPRGRSIVQYVSKDLITWEGPRPVFTPPANVWGDNIQTTSIWAPEIHKYKDKYYLFFTFDSRTPLPSPNQPNKPPKSERPVVYRGSTIAVSDTPTGPYTAITNRSIPPQEDMTLDGTLWVEDGQPYMAYAHEWVQITVGTIEAIKLKDDLSAAIGEPFLLFKSSDAPWAKVQVEGGTVTDGVYFRKSKTGKLFMVWSSFDEQERYNVGLAISPSGKMAGPWIHEPKAMFVENGGHPMLFETFDGKLMLMFHWPNNDAQNQRPRMFELEDTGDSLKIVKEFPGPTVGYDR